MAWGNGTASAVAAPERWLLRLFGTWHCTGSGRRVDLCGREQRVVSLLALEGTRPRRHVAGMLWPDGTDAHALASLRAALFLIQQVAPGLVRAGRVTVGLDEGVAVDVHDFALLAESVVADRAAGDPWKLLRRLDAGDLLPGWYEDWVLFERERLRHLQLQALEALARQQLRSGDLDAAIAAAKAAIAVEPLRESAYRVAIRAHLVSGNLAEAVRSFNGYRTLLDAEMGIAPSGQLLAMMQPVLPRPRR
jgi:DNA-binding SARP family transcriptional activator